MPLSLILTITIIIILSAVIIYLNQKNSALRIEKATLSIENEKLNSHIALLNDNKTHFENITLKALNNNSEQLQEQAQQHIGKTISPLKEEIARLHKHIQDSAIQESTRHGELTAQIRNLADLNHKLQTEASNLSQALQGSAKAQGLWGEMILERVLELSGLRKNQDYYSQKMIDGTSSIPDIIVQLPADRKVIIDAKMSLKAYEAFSAASAANNDEAKQQALSEHVASIQRHIKNLSQKQYHQHSETVFDSVLLFIPIESAWQLALSHQPKLLEESLSTHLLVVTPSTLFAILKVIAQNWELENRSRNAEEIARLSGSLVDKIINYEKDLTEIDKQLTRSQNLLKGAHTKLYGHGGAIKTAHRLKEMGAKTYKNLPSAQSPIQ